MKEKRLGNLWCEFQVLIKNDTKVFWFDVIGEGADVLTDFLRESGLNVCGVTWIIKLLQKKTHLLKICWSVRVEFFCVSFSFFSSYFVNLSVLCFSLITTTTMIITIINIIIIAIIYFTPCPGVLHLGPLKNSHHDWLCRPAQLCQMFYV